VHRRLCSTGVVRHIAANVDDPAIVDNPTDFDSAVDDPTDN
jgi:hypothetical protein